MSRRWYEEIADIHAQRDWSERRRWSCPCAACVEARDDHYEPRGNGWLIDDGGADARR